MTVMWRNMVVSSRTFSFICSLFMLLTLMCTQHNCFFTDLFLHTVYSLSVLHSIHADDSNVTEHSSFFTDLFPHTRSVHVHNSNVIWDITVSSLTSCFIRPFRHATLLASVPHSVHDDVMAHNCFFTGLFLHTLYSHPFRILFISMTIMWWNIIVSSLASSFILCTHIRSAFYSYRWL